MRPLGSLLFAVSPTSSLFCLEVVLTLLFRERGRRVEVDLRFFALGPTVRSADVDFRGRRFRRGGEGTVSWDPEPSSEKSPSESVESSR